MWYGKLVGSSWYYSNQVTTLYDAARNYCNSDVNFSEIPKLIADASSKVSTPAQKALYYADQSVAALVSNLAFFQRELHRAGVEKSRYADLRETYSEITYVLEDVGSERATTNLGKALQEYRDKQTVLNNLLLEYGIHLKHFMPVVAAFITSQWSMIPAGVIEWAMATADEFANARVRAIDVVNRAVGLSDSVYFYAKPLLLEFYKALERYDERADKISTEAPKVSTEILSLATELESRRISTFSPEALSLLARSSVSESLLSAEPKEIAPQARIRSQELLSWIEGNVQQYKNRAGEYLLALQNAEDAYEELVELRDDLKRKIADYDGLVDVCVAFLSKYSPRTEYAREVLPGYVASLRKDPDLSTCARALEIVLKDREYADDEIMLRSCEEEIRCGARVLPSDYACVVGDIPDRLECCMNYRDDLRSRTMGSEMYTRYVEMKHTVEKLLAVVDDPALEAQYLELPTEFLCESELGDAFSKLTKIYLKLRDLASDRIYPVFDYDGYFDAESVSTVRITVLLDAGGADIITKYPVPFQIMSLRALDSNGLTVSVDASGKVLMLRGGGSATVEVQAMPLPLEVEELGSEDGSIYLHVSNPYSLPVRYPFTGSVISASSNVHSDSSYVYFEGVGEAILLDRVVEVNYVVDGDTAYVSVRNVSEHEYKGDVVIPVDAEKLPKNCSKLGPAVVCSVKLDPFGSDSFELGSVTSEFNAYTYTGEWGERTDFSTVSVPIVQTVVSAEVNYSNYLRSKVLELLSELKDYYERADELNATALIPFSEKTIEQIGESVKETNDVLALSSLYLLASETKDSLVSRAKSYVFSIPEHEELRSLAEKALLNGDYVLALALASTYEPKITGRSINTKYLGILVGLLSAAALVYLLRTENKPRKRKKIPKI
ncbi:MAG: hypothetical protein PWQ11_28 [Candidatus Diapherotrites archaeon]|nr:hypothetical protein [Candidatus Diapherotrites archaeon]